MNLTEDIQIWFNQIRFVQGTAMIQSDDKPVLQLEDLLGRV